jgi:lipoprotein-releasing system ATP-binding protein
MSTEAGQLSARGLTKSYFKGGRSQSRGLPGRMLGVARGLVPWKRPKRGIEVPVLLGVDFDVAAGEFVSVVGSSGCGKSTLLHLLGTLDTPDAGEIMLGGRRIDNQPPRERDRLRNQVFGFIFQFYHLLPELDATENVLAPLMIRHSVLTYWRQRKELRQRAESLLERVGLAHRLTHKPNELSGGEMQRAAIARSLVGQPQILLADEPTGNLDAATGQEILDLLISLNRDEGLTIIMVTHDPAIARRADRTVKLEEGRVAGMGELKRMAC